MRPGGERNGRVGGNPEIGRKKRGREGEVAKSEAL